MSITTDRPEHGGIGGGAIVTFIVTFGWQAPEAVDTIRARAARSVAMPVAPVLPEAEINP